MIQYRFNSGSLLIMGDINYFPLWETQQVMQDEIRILVDTTTPRTIILPPVSDFPVQNVRITIVDIFGAAATNNITVQRAGDDTINGTSTLVINGNYDAFRLEPLNTGEWFTVNVGAGGGGGGQNLSVNMTYSQLITNINSNTLITGQRILLTDYATASYIPYSGTPPTGIGGEQVNVGATEPLLLTAISSNEVSLVAESISNSQDLILYQPVMPDGNYEYAASQGKGCITFRMDRSINVSRDYDFRNVVFRRWETVIGNGKFYSYQPVTGAAFQDTLCFPQGLTASQLKNVNVGSPLAIHTSLGYPYWLDNTILNSQYVFNTSIGLAIANTFTYSTFSPSSIIAIININEATFNVVVTRAFSDNIIDNFANNSIILATNTFQLNNCLNISDNTISSKFVGNTIANISGNTCAEISANAGEQIGSNNMPNNSIGNNYAVAINYNTCTGDIINNVSLNIQSNACGTIHDNLVDIVQNNGSSVTSIAGNIASSISENTNAGDISSNTIGGGIDGNSNTGAINQNQCYNILSNAISGAITNNICNIISGNLVNVTSILNNVANVITGNSNTGTISLNTVSDITNNSNAGDISNNTVNFINTNAAPCGLIHQNTGFQILGNTNGGQILLNIVGSIASNSNNGEITNNMGVLISGNNGTGAITVNNVMQILNNNTGLITQNVGYTIDTNTITGTITSNFVLYINSNTEVAPAQADLTNNWSESLSNLTLHGVLLDVNGHLGLCNVLGDVKSHTFIDPILGKDVNPTAEMSLGAIPTKSVFDEGVGKFVLFVVNTGVATYTTVIST